MRAPPRLVWSLPETARPPGRGLRDWGLLAALCVLAALEVAARPELSWRSPSVLVCIALIPTLLWRRSRPLPMVTVAFGASAAVALARLVTGTALPGLHMSAFLLLLPYALFRWGKEREALVGLVLILASASLDFVSTGVRGTDVLGGFAILLSAVALGVAFRYRADAHARELEQVKLREREELARDLHDTVAHHVSAIAIRAQAGLALASKRPEAAVDALRVIEAEASRALTEMRGMVRVLRRGEPADLAPGRRVEDLRELAGLHAEGPGVDVDLSGDLDSLSASVSAAIYRLAQESVTNARRHARHATRIQVGVTVEAASVRLRVSDDGEPVQARPSGAVGYGLIGMAERAALLGGSCHAAPNPERGWTVTAVLPRNGLTP
ncbi:sensor histidine kinase [Pyxidicoccus xibeiensis]|uniref:sensor histidine kinase n=1 Tax=Pyxidicoccus xibeiensis TaxID=2906759 RepID=UPI0020A7ACFA|nr:histidine kinase [Pyxidicoccus xibeiensis]MCP3144984.1 histidine kinase [Pyxidicoccus xibeiensis]